MRDRAQYGQDETFATTQGATTLCKAAEAACLPEQTYPAGTSFKASSSEVRISSEGLFSGAIVCAESSLEGKTSAQVGDPLPLDLSAPTLAKCEVRSSGLTSECTQATAQSLPYAGSLTSSGGGDGSLGVSGSGGAKQGWVIECEPLLGIEVNCALTFEPTLPLEGGNPATLTANRVPMEETAVAGHESCPGSNLNFSGHYGQYSIESPQPLYVAMMAPGG